jgi:hypothetical protein
MEPSRKNVSTQLHPEPNVREQKNFVKIRFIPKATPDSLKTGMK